MGKSKTSKKVKAEVCSATPTRSDQTLSMFPRPALAVRRAARSRSVWLARLI
jgi:hypothetical protein